MPRIATGDTEILTNLRPSRGDDGSIAFECPLCRSSARIIVHPKDNPSTGGFAWWGAMGFKLPVKCPAGHVLIADKGIVRPINSQDLFKVPLPLPVNDRAKAFMNDAWPWLSKLMVQGSLLQCLKIKRLGGQVEVGSEDISKSATKPEIESILLRLTELAMADMGDHMFPVAYAVLAYFERDRPQTRVIRIGEELRQ